MMKNQLAGLMKQAQAMQDNMKRAQDELALMEVEVGAVQDSPARRDAAERERRQTQAEQIIHDDPLSRP